MINSIFFKELKRYTYNDLRKNFACENEERLDYFIKKLKEFGILKAVKKSDEDIDELQYEDEMISEVSNNDEISYVFKFVGVVIVGGKLLKCYPKYISKEEPIIELKQILRVIEKYNVDAQDIKMYNEGNLEGSYNFLAVALYLLKDYYDYGIYKNDKEIIETNGPGEIVWNRTINETFMHISNNKPYYLELQTKRHQNNDQDFFTRLHQIILTKVSNELGKVGIFELFDIMPVELTDEEIDDIGDVDYISYQIIKEMNVEFNTRKQNLLKLFYTYINEKKSIDDIECLSMFGTQNYNLVWEDVCKKIFDDKLHTRIKDIDSTIKYEDIDKELIDIIEKPKWSYTEKTASKTLIPDTIDICNIENNKYFIILDAKYYNPLLEKGLQPQCQPGIESVTKQFLYQLAYKQLILDNNFKVINTFIFPTENNEIVDKSAVEMDIFTKEPLELSPILVKSVPAVEAYDLYLQNKKFDVLKLLNND